MGLSGRNRIRFNRRRFDIRKYLKWQNFFILAIVVFVSTLVVTSVSGYLLSKKIAKSTIVFGKEEKEIEINENNEVVEVLSNIDNSVESNDNNDVDIYTEVAKNDDEKVDENKEDKKVEETEKKTEKVEKNLDSAVAKKQYKKTNLNLCLLGEIMMGGEVTNNLNYMYAGAFKHVYANTRLADFTYANFSTNITNLEKIEDAKSDYLVTSNSISALQALGLDCVSIASDHIIDYPTEIIKNTVNKLEESDIYVAGRQDTPVYFQKDDKRVAIVSTNAVITGTDNLYKKEKISVYDNANFSKNIKEAKENADVVIADIHWGREYTYGVTDQMREIAINAVNSGADLVIGSHALGIYPIVTYNNVPIIYSLGYFIGDSDLTLGRESFIFDVSVSKENKIEEIDMTPIYIDSKKEVLYYKEYNPEKTTEILEQYNRWNNENSLNSSVENDMIKIKFK